MSTPIEAKPKTRPRAPVKRASKGAKWNNAVGGADEQYQLKKQAVIAEASRAFGRHGYKNVSLDEIAKTLNVTKPALYYYFKNKQELVYECHELAMQLGDRVLQNAIASESTGYGRITAFMKNYISLLTDEMGAPAILHDFTVMTEADQKKITLRRRKFDQELRKVMESGVQDGSIAPCNVKLAVFWFMGAIISITQWLHADGNLRGDEVADIFIGFFAHGIRPRQA
ncbi:MAG: TetR/AcrR family transcriptional regulator [Burkholderiaceae bacterium]|nr:TetR/AcrR family transcriptional regulator [Burkholderiaceae bacterium]